MRADGALLLPRVLYICSAARCGSTVTDMFLGGHPQVASLGEANFLGKAIRMRQQCTCGSLVSECSAWASVFTRIAAMAGGADLRTDPYGWPLWPARSLVIVDHERQTRGFHAVFKLHKALLIARSRLPGVSRFRLPLPRLLQEALDNKIHLYNAVSESWGKQVVVDSSKSLFEAIELARRAPDRVQVLLLSRDGRGVFSSRRRSGIDRHRAVRDWARYYERALALLPRHVPAANLVRLSYEELACEPERVGAELCSRLGLSYDPSMLRLDHGLRHMVDGNDTRFSGRDEIRLDERWKSELDSEDLSFFFRHGGQTNSALGYG